MTGLEGLYLHRENAIGDMRLEMARQDDKWGTNFTGRHTYEWAVILGEEVGEVNKAMLEDEYPSSNDAYHDPDGSTAAIEAELIQVAAVALQAVTHLRCDRDAPVVPGGLDGS